MGGTAGRYACPLCGNEFVEADAATGQLTIEHVPPRAVGGKPLCLTCKQCNDRGGSLVDSALAELATMRRMQEALFLKRGSFTGPVAVTVGGVEANAVMSVDNGQLTIEVDKRRNAPGRLDAQIDHFKNYRPEVDDAPPSLNVSGRNQVPQSCAIFVDRDEELAGDEGRINVDAKFGPWPREPEYLWDTPATDHSAEALG